MSVLMERSAWSVETEAVRVTPQEQQEKEPQRTQTAGTSLLFISLYLAAVAAHADDSLAFLSRQRAVHVTEWEPHGDNITPETQTLTGPGAAEGERLLVTEVGKLQDQTNHLNKKPQRHQRFFQTGKQRGLIC